MKAINLEKLKILISEKGLTEKDLAQAANINLRSVKGILKGEIKHPTKATIMRLADVCGVDNNELVIEIEAAPAAEAVAKTQPEDDEVLVAKSITQEILTDNKLKADTHKNIPEPQKLVGTPRIQVKPDFLLIQNNVFEGIVPTIISTDAIISINQDTRAPKIWVGYSLEDGRMRKMVEVFDSYEARNERWAEIMNYLKSRGSLG